jgi:tetratricopeptide (TPR) repeat protein
MNKDAKSKSPASKKAADNSQAGKDKPRLQISARRLWLFRIITVVVTPILMLVLLEVFLRVVGYGYPASTFVKCTVNGKPAYCSNSRFGWRFFPPQITRQFEPFVVPADKTVNTYRIFILGESAAQGDPEPSYCFGRQLSVMLCQQYPSVNFEVFTVAVAAINSHVIVQIAEDCARLKPDLFVVYMGNNEVVGPYGAGTVFAPLSKSLALIRMGVAIRATRSGQLMTRLAGAIGYGGEKQKTWGGLEMFLGKQIRRDDEQMRFVYSHFRHNLEDIVRIAQKSGAKTIVSTVAVNLKDCPPFASLHRAGLDEPGLDERSRGGQQKKIFDGLYLHGIELEKAGDFNGACENYLAAAEIDDAYAEMQFRIGRCLWNLGQFDKAREQYVLAMELDTLRFRADLSINRIIREVSEGRAGQGIYFVDAAGVFEQNSPHNCPGFELFLEHVHPNFSGNYLLAKTVFDRVEQVLPDRIKAQKTRDAAPLSEDVCAERLAFTVYDRLRVTQANLQNISKKQQFINQAYHKEMVDFWSQKVEQLNSNIGPASRAGSLEQYKQAIKLNGTDRFLRLNYAKLLMEDSKYALAAVEQYRLIIEQTPHDYHTLVDLANLEAATGNVDSALKHAIAATRYMPTESLANYTVGAVYQIKGRYKEAQKYLAEAIRLKPQFALAYSNLGWILDQQGKIEQAERVYRKGIEEAPNDPDLHLKLALLLRQKGMLQEAEKERQKAITLDPNIAAQFRSAPPSYVR